MTQREQRVAIIAALAAQGIDVLSGKGGFFIRGEGWITFAQARRRSGIVVPLALKRVGQRVTAYGDYAFVAAINGALKG
ncbi:MAG: hypothetical protein Q7T33_09100 [Dehalococcoidia bacterium]|nr:hypothetical protein [Dehalococcoidia bacterium]